MRKGFTLVELMIVVIIIGILAAIAVPSYVGVSKRAQAARVIADFRTILVAVEMCVADTGEFPPDCYPGRVPRELRPYFADGFSFNLRPSMDVRYDWENWYVNGRPKHPHTGILYGISVTTSDMALINAIDELYDAGFQYSLGNNYTFVIEFIPLSGEI